MDRRDFLKRTASAAAATALRTGTNAQMAGRFLRPNLLFITVDDMNWSLPGFMGNTLGLTPNLDALAARSLRFVKNRTTAPICQPSREAMMTGRAPHRSGGLGFNPINEGVPTLVTVLKAQGYYTAAIHKLEHMQPPSCFPWDFKIGGKDRKPSAYSDGVQTAIQEARARKQPFFINCNINDPHRPFYGSADVYGGMTAEQMDHNEQGEYHVNRELHAEDVKAPDFLENIPAIRSEFAQYCNSAQRMDISIGKVLAVLASAPEAENTIVFFSADHGMPFPFSKATVYDNGTRTPALLNYPGMGHPKSYHTRTCNIDYMPTLLELMKAPAPAGMDGRSWLPLLHGHDDSDREYLVTHVNGLSSGEQFPMRAIQNERYSLVFTPWSDGKLHFKAESMRGLSFPAMERTAKTDSRTAARVSQYLLGIPLAFYDLKNDPGQRINLLDHPEHSAQVEKMKRLLHQYMVKTGDPQLENFENLLNGKPTVVIQPATRRNRDPDRQGRSMRSAQD